MDINRDGSQATFGLGPQLVCVATASPDGSVQAVSWDARTNAEHSFVVADCLGSHAHHQPLSNGHAASRTGGDPGHRAGLLVVHLAADLRSSSAPDRADRSQPARFIAAAAHSERPQPARAGDARHARPRRDISGGRLVVAVRSHSRRPRGCHAAAGAGVCRQAYARSVAIPGELRGAVLGRSIANLRAREFRASRRRARADSALAAAAAGGTEYHGRPLPGSKQRERSADCAASAGDLRHRAATGPMVPHRHTGGDRRDRGTAHQIEPAAVPAAGHALGTASRADTTTHRDPRVDTAGNLTRTA